MSQSRTISVLIEGSVIWHVRGSLLFMWWFWRYNQDLLSDPVWPLRSILVTMTMLFIVKSSNGHFMQETLWNNHPNCHKILYSRFLKIITSKTAKKRQKKGNNSNIGHRFFTYIWPQIDLVMPKTVTQSKMLQDPTVLGKYSKNRLTPVFFFGIGGSVFLQIKNPSCGPVN